MAMALYKRDFHSFSTIQEHAPQGWNWCMSKAYCKWPVIIAITVAIVFAIFTLYCCLRCCGCFRGRSRRRGGGANDQQTPFGFNPLAYHQGYAPAGAPAPGYGPEPPRYAQFDNSRKITEDSLPSMPTWSQGQDRKVTTDDVEHNAGAGAGSDVEMSHMQQKQGLMNNASTIDLAPPLQQAHRRQNSYTGPDFDAVDTSYGGPAHHAASPYTGPDFLSKSSTNLPAGGGGPAPYRPYQPQPTHGRTATQDMGTTYGNTQPPASPTLGHAQGGFAGPPSALQAGRRPEGVRDV